MLFFLERNWLLNSGLHALDSFTTFAFIRHNFALILCYFVSLSEASSLNGYMLSYASAHIFQVVLNFLLVVTHSPKTSQSQAKVKNIPRISKTVNISFGDLLKNCQGVFYQVINASYIIRFKPSWLKSFSHKSW